MENHFVWIWFVYIAICFFDVLRTRYDGGSDKSSVGSMWVVIQQDFNWFHLFY